MQPILSTPASAAFPSEHITGSTGQVSCIVTLTLAYIRIVHDAHRAKRLGAGVDCLHHPGSRQAVLAVPPAGCVIQRPNARVIVKASPAAEQGTALSILMNPHASPLPSDRDWPTVTRTSKRCTACRIGCHCGSCTVPESSLYRPARLPRSTQYICGHVGAG